MNHENNEDDDYELEDFMDGPQHPDYWECTCCGTTRTHRPMGGLCPKCDAQMEEGYL